MTTAECIRQRVSCRRFQETPIPREDIRRVVDLARFSPSWKNTQPVRYIVIDDPALKERMARECIPGQGFNTKTINRAAPCRQTRTETDKQRTGQVRLRLARFSIRQRVPQG